MNVESKEYIRFLISQASVRSKDRQFEMAWQSLEMAHVVAQPAALPHSRVHFEMLCLAIQERSWREIVGQIARLILAAPGSIMGKYPVGNSGRSTVSMFQPMKIEPELARKIEQMNRKD